ncbi:MAG: glycoside hydrolase family 97 N-terminal domain-containing protein [Acidobacteria bacterium]|nr:glycoside hydrolase family 97 N-terminal domain-containing protein [Acidobacteriota bacterium]
MYTRIMLSQVTVTSSDSHVLLTFTLRNGEPVYSLNHRGKPVLLDSRLGLTLRDTGPLRSGFRLLGTQDKQHDETWKPIYGERSEIRDHYREAVVSLEETAASRRQLQIVLRVYNEGAAVRYVIPRQPAISDFVITAEHTEFVIPPGTRAWETHGAQRPHENVWAHELKAQCERPLTLEYPDGRYAALVEAGTRNYARMLLSPAPGRPGTLVSDLSSGPVAAANREQSDKPYVWGTTPFHTPWRGVIVADRPGDLIERNFFLLNLNDRPTVDYSWVRPGKVIREVTLSTKGAKEAVDFARQRNLRYIEFDAGWYGHENDDTSDARAVNVDPLRKQKDPAYIGLDLPEVIRYARDNGIGVWLYVNRRALEKQWNVLAPMYESWGVKGVKFGFVNVGSQFWTKWLYDAVELAGKHHLMVDIHDEHRPTGVSRTLPNLLTQEGIAGNETMPTADHNTVMPFTRYIAGAADFTICYYVDRIKTTRAHQLATAVVFYSPLQFLYWYDRPRDYNGEPEVEFFDRVPTVWDETKAIDGAIGRYASIARRSGDDWFIGTINNSVPRRLKLPLSFLPAGRKFTAHIYENGRGGPKSVAMSKRTVDAATMLEAALAEAGGQAVWLETVR